MADTTHLLVIKVRVNERGEAVGVRAPESDFPDADHNSVLAAAALYLMGQTKPGRTKGGWGSKGARAIRDAHVAVKALVDALHAEKATPPVVPGAGLKDDRPALTIGRFRSYGDEHREADVPGVGTLVVLSDRVLLTNVLDERIAYITDYGYMRYGEHGGCTAAVRRAGLLAWLGKLREGGII